MKRSNFKSGTGLSFAVSPSCASIIREIAVSEADTNKIENSTSERQLAHNDNKILSSKCNKLRTCITTPEMCLSW